MLSKKYDAWEKACWVRTGPRYVIDEPEQAGQTYFPRALVPYAQQVEDRWGPETLRRVLIQQLYCYLRFTELLELKSINQVGHQIALGELTVPVSADLRSRAYLLVRDEAHHATASDDVARQVEQRTGVERRADLDPYFLTSLGRTAELLGRDLAPLAEIAFATVSETLISGSLAQIPADPCVVPVVRDYTAAHAIDEARHRSYFCDLFQVWWPQLPLTTRDRLGAQLPELCAAFLSPDRVAHERGLIASGVPIEESRELVRASIPDSPLGPAAQRPLQATLSLFERSGVFELASAWDAFAAVGLHVRRSPPV